MVKKRVIPCLDVAGGRVVKGIRFENLREMGDPVEFATRYSELGADELVFLDITATIEGRRPLLELVERAAEELTIPFTVGGGVATLDDARGLLRAGADKVAVNRAAVDEPELLGELAEEFGAQAVVCAIDSRGGEVVTDAGRRPRGLDAVAWAREAVERGAGESDERLVEELADLWFHSYVLLAARGLDPAAVEDELRRRVPQRSPSRLRDGCGTQS